MSFKISFKNRINLKQSGNYVLFVDESNKIFGSNKLKFKTNIKKINKIVKSCFDLKNDIKFLNIDEKTFFLIKVKSEINHLESEKLGASFFKIVKESKFSDFLFFESNFNDENILYKNFLPTFLHGSKLASYSFDKYKNLTSQKKIDFSIEINKNRTIVKIFNQLSNIFEGVALTKDLVSEPGNVLFPEEYARRISSLKKIGLKVKTYNEKELKKMGMGALLGVGQGSSRQSYLVTIEWNGLKKKIDL